MSPAKKIDADYLSNQYRDGRNLNARILLHQRLSTNPYGWFRWVFDQLNLPAQGRILELGCGAGTLWLENLDRIPPGWEITLSDFSAGMLTQAQANLGGRRAFDFKEVDARSTPLPFVAGLFGIATVLCPMTTPLQTISRVVNGRMDRAVTRAWARVVPGNSTTSPGTWPPASNSRIGPLLTNVLPARTPAIQVA